MMGIRRVAVRMLRPFMRMFMAVLSGSRKIVRMGMVDVAVVMPVLVRRSLVDMRVPVALRAGKISSGDHQPKRQHKRSGKALTEDQYGENHPNEGRDCVIGARPGRSKFALRENIEVDAETIRYETK